MIKELTKLHDHVSVAAVWEVVCGVQLVVHLRNGPRVWKSVGQTSSARLLNSILICTFLNIGTGCPKNAILTLEANISGLKEPIGESRTSFENYMFSALIWAQKQVNSVPTSMRKSGFKNLT